MLVKEKNRKWDILTDQLSDIAVSVDLLAKGDPDVAIAAGFDLAKEGKSITELAAPTGVSVVNVDRSGSIKLAWNNVVGAINYAIEYASVGETIWQNGTYSTAKNAIMAGLKPGTNIMLRIRALGRRNLVSEWSQEVSVWVA